jgi:hypothetical protein
LRRKRRDAPTACVRSSLARSGAGAPARPASLWWRVPATDAGECSPCSRSLSALDHTPGRVCFPYFGAGAPSEHCNCVIRRRAARVAWPPPANGATQRVSRVESLARTPAFEAVELTPAGDHVATLELEVLLELLERDDRGATGEAEKRVPIDPTPSAHRVNPVTDPHGVAGHRHANDLRPVGKGSGGGGELSSSARQSHRAAASSSESTAATPAGVSENSAVFTSAPGGSSSINFRSRSVTITLVAYLPMAAATSP